MGNIKNTVWHRPFIVAGPCSVETREQTLQTCTELAEGGMVDMLRGGVWKPRTNPGSFEGVGEVGLGWLAEAKQSTGLPFGVEVVNSRHVEAALRYGADMVWIGARTTVNPFSVQEIVDAAKGTEVSLFLKNPINPDINLWAGALDRMLYAGIDPGRIALILRGFSQGVHGSYRNPPMWHIALEMRRRYPDVMMLCDPSHICGNREGLLEISRRAADLSFDGLMLESHIDPDTALSDAAQQLTPAAMKGLLTKIKWREEDSSEPGFVRELERCRSEIDHIDAELFELLSRRMGISQEIGGIKKNNDVTIFQPVRWERIVEKVMSRAATLDLSPEFLQAVLEAIHIESINHQNKVMNPD